MRRMFIAVLWVGVVVFAGLAASAYFGGSMAYDESGRWFAAATYQSECTVGKPSEGRPGCFRLMADPPHWPSGVRITDTSVLLSLGSSEQSTGSAVMTISGLFLTAAGLFLSLAASVGARARSSR